MKCGNEVESYKTPLTAFFFLILYVGTICGYFILDSIFTFVTPYMVEYVFLGITGVSLISSLLLLFFRLKSTEDIAMRKRHKRTYVPVINWCVLVITLYVLYSAIHSFLE